MSLKFMQNSAQNSALWQQNSVVEFCAEICVSPQNSGPITEFYIITQNSVQILCLPAEFCIYHKILHCDQVLWD